MYKKLLIILSIILALGIFLTSCGKPVETTTTESSQTEKVASASTVEDVSDATTSTDLTSGSVTAISLSNSETTFDGEGAALVGSDIVITSGGSYILSGTLNGQILVEAPKTTDVYLVLDNVNITAQNNAAIYCKQAKNLMITLADGSTNIVTDALDFSYVDSSTEEPDATIFSKVDLTLNGTGTLELNANFYNGIGTKDDLIIDSGNYVITSSNHGLRGRDSLTINDGTFKIVSGNDGIQSNNDEDATKGWVNISGGSFDITSVHDGIQSETTMDITGGTFTVLAGDGYTSTIIMDDQTNSDSYKGFKAGGNLNVTSGDFNINSADDTLHSNNNITINNGRFILNTGDDGIHSDGELTINNGDIDIQNSYEGIEASIMNLNGGNIALVSNDDGINVAGGTDDTETETTTAPPAQGRFGNDNFSANSNRWLYINGGTISVNAEGDGIDVNGNTKMIGGSVYVSGPTGNGNGSLDFDGTFDIEGGNLIAAGSSGMAMSPSANSSQPSLMVYFSSSQSATTEVQLQNSSGNVIASYAPEKQFQTIVFSVPELNIGETYILLANGKELSEITLSENITTLSETGEAVSIQGGFGGGGGRGGGMGARPESGSGNLPPTA